MNAMYQLRDVRNKLELDRAVLGAASDDMSGGHQRMTNDDDGKGREWPETGPAAAQRYQLSSIDC
jgi:hypothetical protein